MKITLTITEITALVLKTYGLPENTTLEVADFAGIDHPDARNLFDALTREKCLEAGQIRPEMKIASIKLLRSAVCGPSGAPTGKQCGLANAKYAIEDFEHFMGYVRRYGFPDMNYSGLSAPWHLPSPR
jgi:hypothetical protein